jgi:hypothetical protein
MSLPGVLEVSRILLAGTVSRTLLLRATVANSNVVAYIDAAYALHGDSKSHTGVVIYVGNTLVYVSSRKQKCMSKSPTEAELIALTDNLGLVELFQEFVDYVTKKTTKTPVIFQDCNATDQTPTSEDESREGSGG